ncbi:MAG: thioredoxin family protein [Elusimicrobiota bacterium]
MKKLNNPDNVNTLMNASKSTAIFFSLSYCPYCNMFRPVFQEYADNFGDTYEFVEVILDDDACPLWDEYGIKVTPTVLIFKNGKVSKRADGRPGYGLDRKAMSVLFPK